MIENKIKNYLEIKITYSWYKNAKIDYDITGKFINAIFEGNNLTIVWEEMGEKLMTTIPYYKEYSKEQLYDIWMEQDFEVLAS